MPISYAENAALTCPACGERFTAEIWTLVDAAERPDLVDLLHAGALNVVTCLRCGNTGPAGAPLLLHDPARRRVYFAAPADAAEHEVREQAQSLLYALVGSLPEEARLPYLGDVQVEQEVEGVRRAVLRRARRGPERPGARPESPAPPAGAAPAAPQAAQPPEPARAPSDPSPMLEAVRAMLAADSAEGIEAVLAQHPQLLDPAADIVIAGLADIAYAQGERDVARALAEARQILSDVRAGEDARPGQVERVAAGAADGADAQEPEVADESLLPGAAYQALMQAAAPAALAGVVRDHPVLLEPWADDDLGLRAEAALDEGDERLARAIEARRDSLAELRAELTDEAALVRAMQELIRAGEEEDALAQTLSDHPVLLTDAAQEALFRLAAEARARGDDALAERAVEYRAMLRKVREGLEESP